MTDPHKKSKDETILVELLHKEINNETSSGIKIKDSYNTTFPGCKIVSTIVSGANRTTHHDMQIQTINSTGDEIIQNVELKSSKYFRTIDTTKHPWVTGIQFYNGSGDKFSIGKKYARDFYDTFLDEIILHLEIQTPKPTFEEWSKDAFKQGKPSTPFVRELREKGYKSKYLSDCRKKFNKHFTVDQGELDILMKEVHQIAHEALNCKDYWLQIHGNIENHESFHVRWTGKIEMPQIQSVEQIRSKSDCDINFKFMCIDQTEFTAKMRWGYGQCISNIRIDIK
jgi:hypothetical protein